MLKNPLPAEPTPGMSWQKQSPNADLGTRKPYVPLALSNFRSTCSLIEETLKGKEKDMTHMSTTAQLSQLGGEKYVAALSTLSVFGPGHNRCYKQTPVSSEYITSCGTDSYKKSPSKKTRTRKTSQKITVRP